MRIYKLTGPEVAIGSANTVANSTLVRVINTGAAAVLNVAYANSLVYANTTVANTGDIIIQKGATDTLTGANMRATPLAYKG